MFQTAFLLKELGKRQEEKAKGLEITFHATVINQRINSTLSLNLTV